MKQPKAISVIDLNKLEAFEQNMAARPNNKAKEFISILSKDLMDYNSLRDAWLSLPGYVQDSVRATLESRLTALLKEYNQIEPIDLSPK